MSPPVPSAPINLTAMSVDALATLLTKLGGDPVTPEMIRQDLEAGAPCNGDQSLNLVHYTAWIVKEAARRAH